MRKGLFQKSMRKKCGVWMLAGLCFLQQTAFFQVPAMAEEEKYRITMEQEWESEEWNTDQIWEEDDEIEFGETEEDLETEPVQNQEDPWEDSWEDSWEEPEEAETESSGIGESDQDEESWEEDWNDVGSDGEDQSEEEWNQEDWCEDDWDEEVDPGTEEADEDAEEESENLEEMEEESDEEMEDETEEEDIENDAELIAAYADRTLTASGKSVEGSAGWKEVEEFSPEFAAMRFYPGVSSFEPFNNSNKVLYRGAPFPITYFYPTAKGLGGSFGGIYRKVIFQDGRWYDLKMTVDAYSASTVCRGGERVGVFPFISFTPDKIEWSYNEALGEVVIRCEICDSETGIATPLNTRFEWRDLDGAQRFGIRALDGEISGRYYYPGTRVHVQNGQTVSGIGQMEVVVSPPEEASRRDKENTVCYELSNCSSYYMAFPYRDHINDDEYSYSKAYVNEAYNAFLKNNFSKIEVAREIMVQDGTSLNLILTPEPKKAVSEDQENWYTEIELKEAKDPYWYEITQEIPWQDLAYFYSDFQIEDELQEGITYLGNASVIRVEDEKDVSDWFVISEDAGVVLATAKSETCRNSNFYGYHYQLRFQVKMDLQKISPEVQEKNLCYVVYNHALCNYRYMNQAEFCQEESNTVSTGVKLTLKEPEAPKKGFDGDMNQTEKNLSVKTEEIVFSIHQSLPEITAGIEPEYLKLQDSLEDCFSIIQVTAEGKKKQSDIYQMLETGIVREQPLEVIWDFDSEYAGGEIRFLIHCKLKKEADLNRYLKGQEVQIPNKASVTFYWSDPKQDPLTKDTNEVLVRYSERRLCLIKEIDGNDIVWEHGEPTFFFHIKGEDLSGKLQEYYRPVTFSYEEGKSGRIRKETTLHLPPGEYLVEEVPVIRYQLKNVYDIVHGRWEGSKVWFDLKEKDGGSAVFYNEKRNDEATSDTALVRNIFD